MAIKPRGDCDFDLSEIVQKVSAYSGSHSKLRIVDYLSESHINSAVLIPIVIHKGQIGLLFTLRSNSLDRHSGQVSFPGGVIEKGDRSIIETALREAKEEVGLLRKNVQIIGQLETFNTSAGIVVFPVIGVIKSLDKLARNEIEVDRIFCIPLKWLCDPAHSKIKDFSGSDGNIRKVWFFDVYDGELLWGITAKITKDFIDLIKK
jgi:8-oxo-dGTP pyrophosphatase MutT (NUDIX family)